MRVGLNLIFLVPGETGGMEVYARELIPALLTAAPSLELVCFINREAAESGDGPWGNLCSAVTVPVRARRRAQWVRGEQQHLPRLARRAGVDVLHSLGSTAPAWGDFVRVTTIHDLIYRLDRRAHFGINSLGMSLLVPLAARRSHRIITPSASTRDHLVSALHAPGEKIDVVRFGFGATRRVAPEPEPELRARLGIDGRPVVLTVSAKRPHKNLEALLDAWKLLPPPRPILIFPGYRTPHEDELRARSRALELESDVRFVGWVPDSTLEGLYAIAQCCVLPSRYEGFGLPVLEAMSRGVPVACSGGGALGEVAGAAARLFDPGRPDEIAAAVGDVLASAETANELRALGRERAAEFTWERAARGTLASYSRALA